VFCALTAQVQARIQQQAAATGQSELVPVVAHASNLAVLFGMLQVR
jgi:hypothetical protein